MGTILDEILTSLPEKADITISAFEGANIVLYTKNIEFFLDSSRVIRTLVSNFKKRIEIRLDPSLLMGEDDSKEMIKKVLPKEVGETNIIFDPQRSRVIIEAEKPGIAIGKQGEVLKEIKKQTHWIPIIKRIPAIKSKLIENIRQVLYENNDDRRKFLDKVGKRIYGGWKRNRKSEWIRVSFLGAAREVGRSCLLLQTSESRIMLDCGLNTAATDENAFPILDAPEFNINDLDAVIISHSHLDHVGLLPYLFKYGYTGPVYMTAPTRDISALLCLDFVSIAQKENKKELYGSKEVKEMVKNTICLGYEEVTDITPDVRLTLYNAGHTLGSSLVHLNIGNGQHNLLYTGDMNYENSNLLAAAVTKFPRLETAIMEGTYGGKTDILPTREECEKFLIKTIKETITRGGKVLMPVLGVGRSQEILLILERNMRNGEIPQVPIFIHGSVWDVVAIHTTYPDFFNSAIKKEIFHKDHNPFLSDIFKRIAGQKEMKQVTEETGPCIIMATSGMMVGGPSVEYFKQLAEDKRHSLVLTCYQGEGSLGRRLESGEKDINLAESGSKPNIIKVKMDVHSIHGFTGHSDRRQAINFMKRLYPKPKRVMIVHGEKSKCIDLASSIHQLLKIETSAPKILDCVRLK